MTIARAGKERTMIVATLTRTTVVADAEEFEKRRAALLARVLPYLQRQPGFVAHELRRDGEGGGMIETTTWSGEGDCRAFLRGGAAAMAATWLDAFFPTAPYPNGNWVRTTSEVAG
jgi:heme-degrading monooxygenase HmoA